MCELFRCYYTNDVAHCIAAFVVSLLLVGWLVGWLLRSLASLRLRIMVQFSLVMFSLLARAMTSARSGSSKWSLRASKWAFLVIFLLPNPMITHRHTHTH